RLYATSPVLRCDHDRAGAQPHPFHVSCASGGHPSRGPTSRPCRWWNYNPDNDYEVGDHRNGEDFSIITSGTSCVKHSKELLRPSLGHRISAEMVDHYAGGRCLDAFLVGARVGLCSRGRLPHQCSHPALAHRDRTRQRLLVRLTASRSTVCWLALSVPSST